MKIYVLLILLVASGVSFAQKPDVAAAKPKGASYQVHQQEKNMGLSRRTTWTVTCTFSDGTSWEGTTSNWDVVLQMIEHCLNSPDD